jgi:HTH-type transcriptional regulator/antitoxin HigA
MADLTYTIIKSDKQYHRYCGILEELVNSGLESQEAIDEYELLNLLISEWDEKHHDSPALDPVELVRALKENHKLSQKELGKIAGVGKSYVSEILNYKKRMSKKVIRNICDHFKIRQEALNKPYRLKKEALAT